MPHEAGHEEERRDPFRITPELSEAIQTAREEAPPGEMGQTFPDPTYDIPLEDLEILRDEFPALFRRITQYTDRGTDRGQQQAYSLWAEWSQTRSRSQRRTVRHEHEQARAEVEAQDALVQPSDTYISTLNRSGLRSQEFQEQYRSNFAQLLRYYESSEGGSLSPQRARIEATRRLMYWMVVPRTASGNPMELAADIRPEDYDRVSSGRALLSAFLPQTLSSAEEASDWW